MTTPAPVVPLDQNRRHADHNAANRTRPGQLRSGLESYLLATMASATSLIEITAGIQKRAAEALQALPGYVGEEAAAQRLSAVEDALRRLRRVEDAIQVLTSFPDGRRDWPDRPNRRQSSEATGQAAWPVEPLTAREEAVLRLLRGTLSLREIAQELGVSKNTVKSQVQAIYRKLHVSDRRAAIQRGRELSILSRPDKSQRTRVTD
jgi:DNA-binding NarL/FixJ family response regulator